MHRRLSLRAAALHLHLMQTARGVQKWGNLFAVFVKLPQLGGAPPLRTRLGAWPTLEAAARVHDAALIAILGPKARPPAMPAGPGPHDVPLGMRAGGCGQPPCEPWRWAGSHRLCC